MRLSADQYHQAYITYLSEQRAGEMAATVAALRAERPLATGYPPVTAPPVRRCSDCQ